MRSKGREDRTRKATIIARPTSMLKCKMLKDLPLAIPPILESKDSRFAKPLTHPKIIDRRYKSRIFKNGGIKFPPTQTHRDRFRNRDI